MARLVDSWADEPSGVVQIMIRLGDVRVVCDGRGVLQFAAQWDPFFFGLLPEGGTRLNEVQLEYDFDTAVEFLR